MDKTNIEHHLEQLCIRHGMRMTDQRRIIAKILTESKDHPDAEEIFNRAKIIDNKIKAIEDTYGKGTTKAEEEIAKLRNSALEKRNGGFSY